MENGESRNGNPPSILDSRMNATAAILAGGKATRMGADKACLPLEGKPIIVRLVERLRDAFRELLIVTGTPEISGLVPGVRCTPDVFANMGPLGGLHAALKAARTEWLFVVGCDMPFVSLPLARHLYGQRSDCDIVIPLSGEGKYETLHAFYSDRCLPAVERQIERGEHKLLRFFPGLRVRETPAVVCRRFDPDLRMFFNLNTPEEYEALEASWQEE